VRATPTSTRPPRFHFSESSGWTVRACPNQTKRRTGRDSDFFDRSRDGDAGGAAAAGIERPADVRKGGLEKKRRK
jgi:hypothetical protein